MDRRDLRNVVLNFVGESLWGLTVGIVAPATVLPVLLLKHGASKQMIGALDAVSMCLMLLPQTFGVYIFHSRKKRKVRLVLWHILALQPLMIIMGMLTLYSGELGNAVFRWSLLAVYALFSFNVGVMVAAWMGFLAGVFPGNIRGSALGMASFGSCLATAGGALLAGWLIKEYPGAAVYGWLYIVSGLAGIVIINIWLLIDDSSQAAEETHPPDVSLLMARFRQSLSDSNFRNFIIGRVLATSGFCVISFFAVYFRSKSGPGLSDGFIIQAMAAMTLGTALTSPLIGRLGDKKGHRLAVMLGTFGQALTFAVILLVPGKVGCILTYAIAGCCLSCSFVSNYNLILETCPHDCHTTHISIANLAIGVPLGIAPLCAGWIAQANGTRTLFVVSMVLSLAAFIWIYLKVLEPRALTQAAGWRFCG